MKTLAKRLGVSFKDWSLLHQALTHTSYANEAKNPGILHNERLEFLGDAVLGLCVSEMLLDRWPSAREGELSRMRAALVNTYALASFATSHEIPKFMRFGRGTADSADAITESGIGQPL